MAEVTDPFLRLPDRVRALAWDVDPGALDRERHSSYVMERVLELGDPEACRWLLDSYGRNRVRAFVQAEGPRRLTPRALNYWAFILDIEDRQCLRTSCLANNNPLWSA